MTTLSYIDIANLCYIRIKPRELDIGHESESVKMLADTGLIARDEKGLWRVTPKGHGALRTKENRKHAQDQETQGIPESHSQTVRQRVP